VDNIIRAEETELCSSVRVPTYKVLGPEFKPQCHLKKKKNIQRCFHSVKIPEKEK
jgi:hypothetical protein